MEAGIIVFVCIVMVFAFLYALFSANHQEDDEWIEDYLKDLDRKNDKDIHMR